jgi:hypothetical protein
MIGEEAKMGWPGQPISPAGGRESVLHEGREALKRLKGDLSWPDWIKVGKGLLIGREECKKACGLENTNSPPNRWGGAYSRAFAKWLEKEQLEFDKGDRSRLFDVMDNLPAIEAWRGNLTLPERRGCPRGC